jgi:pyrroloquinoline-quinone synthase
MTFDSQFEDLHLLKHPFYRAWMAGELSQETLQDYAQQYFFHVDRFPRYLSAIHSHCEETGARREILENLNDEEGLPGRDSHPELWLQFVESLGVDRAEAQKGRFREAIQKVSATFFHYARKSFHEGLGALYAYESQVPEIAHSKIEGLKAHYALTDPKGYRFFEVHKEADVEHRKVILKMIDALPAKERAEATVAARAAAEALWDFLSDVQKHEGQKQVSAHA